jgi:hypothetical protein
MVYPRVLLLLTRAAESIVPQAGEPAAVTLKSTRTG